MRPPINRLGASQGLALNHSLPIQSHIFLPEPRSMRGVMLRREILSNSRVAAAYAVVPRAMEPQQNIGTSPAATSNQPSFKWGRCVVACLFVAGCMSPEEAVDSADAEVYALVQETRDSIFGSEMPFSIQPPDDSLRQRLMRGEGLDDPRIINLSLEQCLEIAAENSRNFQSQKESLYIDALDLTLERWRFGTIFSLGGSAGVGGSGLDDGTASLDADGSASKLFGSGGRLVTNIGASLFRAIGTGDGWDALSNIGLSFTQPLLRGSAREVVMEPLTQAERNLVYGVRSFERFRSGFAEDVARRYYNLLLTKQTVKNELDNIDMLELLSRRNRAFAEAGKLNEIDAGQADQGVLASRNRLVELEGRLERELDSFKLFLGLPIDTPIQLDGEALASLEIQDAVELLHGWSEDQLTKLALTQRLDFLNNLEQLIDAERSARIAADQLRVGLGLTTSLNGNSTTGSPLSYSDDRLPWSVELDLDLPVDQIPERNSYRRSLISYESRKRSMEELAESIRVDLRDSIRSTETTEARFRLQLETVALNRRRVKSSSMKLEAGRADTRALLESQRDLLDALNAADAALVDFTLAKLDFYRQLELVEFDSTGIVVHIDKLATGPSTPNLDSDNE